MTNSTTIHLLLRWYHQVLPLLSEVSKQTPIEHEGHDDVGGGASIDAHTNQREDVGMIKSGHLRAFLQKVLYKTLFQKTYKAKLIKECRGWDQEALTACGKAECCMVPQDPTLSALLLIQHILSMLIVFSSLKSSKLCCMTKVADSYSMASSFDPPTQNSLNFCYMYFSLTLERFDSNHCTE